MRVARTQTSNADIRAGVTTTARQAFVLGGRVSARLPGGENWWGMTDISEGNIKNGWLLPCSCYVISMCLLVVVCCRSAHKIQWLIKLIYCMLLVKEPDNFKLNKLLNLQLEK